MSNGTALLALVFLFALFGIARSWLDQRADKPPTGQEEPFDPPEMSLAKFE